MLPSDSDIRARAAAVAEQGQAGIEAGRSVEWLEELVVSAMLEVARRERERCATIAEERAALWEGTAQGMAAMSSPALPEARARMNEALAIADALRVAV
jgi:hypothetical protein